MAPAPTFGHRPALGAGYIRQASPSPQLPRLRSSLVVVGAAGVLGMTLAALSQPRDPACQPHPPGDPTPRPNGCSSQGGGHGFHSGSFFGGGGRGFAASFGGFGGHAFGHGGG